MGKHLLARLRWLVAIFLVPLSTPAWATFPCTGEIQHFGTEDDGRIYINIGWGTWGICSVSFEVGGVSAEACKTWYATLTAAKLGARQVTLFFNPNHSLNLGVATCEGLGHWQHRIPYHLSIM